MNTLRKDSTMTPAAKAVLDTTTAALSTMRTENATLKRENERLQRAMDIFLGSPSKAARAKAQKAMRGDAAGRSAPLSKITAATTVRKIVEPAVRPILNPDGSIDTISTAIKKVHAGARR